MRGPEFRNWDKVENEIEKIVNSTFGVPNNDVGSVDLFIESCSTVALYAGR